MAAKSFEDRLIDIAKMTKRFQFEWEESITRFQSKVEDIITQGRQDLSLLYDKFDKAIEATVKEKKNKLLQAAEKEKENKRLQVQSSRLQPNQHCYKRRIKAKLFWKKFVVASQQTCKLWISLGKIFERWSFQEYPQVSMKVSSGPYKTAYLLKELAKQFHDYYLYLVSSRVIQQRTWDPGINIFQNNTLRTRCF